MNIGKTQLANGRRGEDICQKNMSTVPRVFEHDIDFLRYRWTKFSFYTCFTTFSETFRTPQTDGQTIKGFRAQPPGKSVRIRIRINSLTTEPSMSCHIKKVQHEDAFKHISKYSLEREASNTNVRNLRYAQICHMFLGVKSRKAFWGFVVSSSFCICHFGVRRDPEMILSV